MGQEKIAAAVSDLATCIETSFSPQSAQLADFARTVAEAFQQDRRLLIAGSGSLAAVGDLVATLFLYRLGFERPQLPVVSLGGNPSLLQALARDSLQRQHLARQIRLFARQGDLLLTFADGHRDEALIEGLQAARQAGCQTILLIPAGTELSGEPPDIFFPVSTESPARLHESALFFGQLLCQLVESELFGI